LWFVGHWRPTLFRRQLLLHNGLLDFRKSLPESVDGRPHGGVVGVAYHPHHRQKRLEFLRCRPKGVKLLPEHLVYLLGGFLLKLFILSPP
jgi:hypothetical protein